MVHRIRGLQCRFRVSIVHYILGGRRSRSFWKPLQGQIYLKDIVLALASVIFRFYCIWIMTITVNLDSIQLFSIFHANTYSAIPIHILLATPIFSCFIFRSSPIHLAILSVYTLQYCVLGLTECTYSEPSHIE